MKLVPAEGFEPPTLRFVIWCSIQLSYAGVIGGPWGIRTPDILFRRQALYPAELRIREMVPLAGFEPATYGLLNRCSTKWAKAALLLDAPLGLEPRLTDSKSALLPIRGRGNIKASVLYMLSIASSNILDARLGLEPRTYWVRVSRSTNWSIGQCNLLIWTHAECLFLANPNYEGHCFVIMCL